MLHLWIQNCVRTTQAMLQFLTQLQQSIVLYRDAALALQWLCNYSTKQVTDELCSAEVEKVKTTHYRSSSWQASFLTVCSSYNIFIGFIRVSAWKQNLIVKWCSTWSSEERHRLESRFYWFKHTYVFIILSLDSILVNMTKLSTNVKYP